MKKKERNADKIKITLDQKVIKCYDGLNTKFRLLLWLSLFIFEVIVMTVFVTAENVIRHTQMECSTQEKNEARRNITLPAL